MPLSHTRRNFAVSLAVLVFFVVILAWTYHFEEARGQEFPALVSMAAILLCLVDLIAHTDTFLGQRLAAVLGAAHRAGGGLVHGARQESVAVVWIVGATLVMVVGGFVVGIPVYVFCYMVLHAGRTVRQGAIAALATAGAIWLAFELLLSYELYPGLAFGS